MQLPVLHHHFFRQKDDGIENPNDLSNLVFWLDNDNDVTEDGAAEFTRANSESLSRAGASITNLPSGNITAWWAGWYYPDDAAAIQYYFGSGGGTNATTNFFLRSNTAARPTFTIGDGTTQTSVTGDINDFVLGEWVFAFCYYDSVNDLVGMIIDNSKTFTTSQTTGINNSEQTFYLGSINAGSYLDGSIDSFAWGISPTTALTDISTLLYNAGTGKTYADLSTAEKTGMGLISWYNLDEQSGTRNDSHGTNHLTDNNTVTFRDGIVAGTASDNGAVSIWNDQSGGNHHFSQSTASKRSVYDVNILNGINAIDFDGTDDLLVFTEANALSTATSGAFFCIVTPQASTLTGAIFSTCDTGVSDEYFGIATILGIPCILQQNTSGTQNVTMGTTVLASGTSYILSFISDGSAWRIRVNGVEETLQVTSGANNGNWIGDTANRDNAAIAAVKNDTENTFWNGRIFHPVLLDGPVTEKQITDTEAWLSSISGL